jgi:hypothetical protein
LEELFTVLWSPDGQRVIVGGKRKDRTQFNEEEQDYATLEGHIKVQ